MSRQCWFCDEPAPRHSQLLTLGFRRPFRGIWICRVCSALEAALVRFSLATRSLESDAPKRTGKRTLYLPGEPLDDL